MYRPTKLRRRVLAAAIAIPALLTILPPTALAADRTVSKRVCDFDWKESRREVKRLIRCAARRWGSPGGADKALDVARCESGLSTDAFNPGGYAGIYQHAIRYWPERADRWGFPDRSIYNGRANVIVSIRMANAADGWRIWGCG